MEWIVIELACETSTWHRPVVQMMQAKSVLPACCLSASATSSTKLLVKSCTSGQLYYWKVLMVKVQAIKFFVELILHRFYWLFWVALANHIDLTNLFLCRAGLTRKSVFHLASQQKYWLCPQGWGMDQNFSWSVPTRGFVRNWFIERSLSSLSYA